MAPQHSLAFIRPIQRDGADDNDSSCSPSIPPPCHSLLSCSLPLLGRLSLSFSLFFSSLPFSLSLLKTRNACRSVRGLRIGWGIERREGQPVTPPIPPPVFFSFFDIFSPALGFVSQVARVFFPFFSSSLCLFQILRPCCLVGTILKPTVTKKELVQATDSIDNFRVLKKEKKIHKSRSSGCC